MTDVRSGCVETEVTRAHSSAVSYGVIFKSMVVMLLAWIELADGLVPVKRFLSDDE